MLSNGAALHSRLTSCRFSSSKRVSHRTITMVAEALPTSSASARAFNSIMLSTLARRLVAVQWTFKVCSSLAEGPFSPPNTNADFDL